jgi:RNA polymerase sigma factor (sigma-70 family)
MARVEGDAAAELVLLERYTPLVRHIASSLRTMQPQLLDRDDAIQDGMIGLLRAIRTNRQGHSDARFSAFARVSIRGAIIDGYRAAGDLSRTDYAEAKRVREALAAGLLVSAQEKDRAEGIFVNAWAPTVDVTCEVGEGATLADSSPGPEQRAISNQLLRRAVDSLQRMSVRNRTIFIACEIQGEKHASVAKKFTLSSGRVSQIIKAVRQEVLLSLA